MKRLWDGTEEEKAEVRAHAARMNGIANSSGSVQVQVDGQAAEGSDGDGAGMTAALLPRASNSSEPHEPTV